MSCYLEFLDIDDIGSTRHTVYLPTFRFMFMVNVYVSIYQSQWILLGLGEAVEAVEIGMLKRSAWINLDTSGILSSEPDVILLIDVSNSLICFAEPGVNEI